MIVETTLSMQRGADSANEGRTVGFWVLSVGPKPDVWVGPLTINHKMEYDSKYQTYLYQHLVE